MTRNLPQILLGSTALGAPGHLWATSGSLPPIVAAHFDASGAVNGHVPRKVYLWLVAALLVGAPFLLVLLPMRSTASAGGRPNRPDQEHWEHWLDHRRRP